MGLRSACRIWVCRATLIGVVAAIVLVPSMVRAGADDADEASVTATIKPDAMEALSNAEFPARAAVRALIEKETAATGLPPDIAEAVVFVESRYDSTVVGSVGEIGLMQVRPETAAMLGFRGTMAELAEPKTNIHYGVIYLTRAWRLAQGDLCRTLMKYRAGHGEETMTPRSVIYCNRARNRLIAMNSPFALPGAVAAMPPERKSASFVADGRADQKTGSDEGTRAGRRCLRDLQAGHASGEPRLLGRA